MIEAVLKTVAKMTPAGVVAAVDRDERARRRDPAEGHVLAGPSVTYDLAHQPPEGFEDAVSSVRRRERSGIEVLHGLWDGPDAGGIHRPPSWARSRWNQRRRGSSKAPRLRPIRPPAGEAEPLAVAAAIDAAMDPPAANRPHPGAVESSGCRRWPGAPSRGRTAAPAAARPPGLPASASARTGRTAATPAIPAGGTARLEPAGSATSGMGSGSASAASRLGSSPTAARGAGGSPCSAAGICAPSATGLYPPTSPRATARHRLRGMAKSAAPAPGLPPATRSADASTLGPGGTRWLRATAATSSHVRGCRRLPARLVPPTPTGSVWRSGGSAAAPARRRRWPWSLPGRCSVRARRSRPSSVGADQGHGSVCPHGPRPLARRRS